MKSELCDNCSTNNNKISKYQMPDQECPIRYCVRSLEHYHNLCNLCHSKSLNLYKPKVISENNNEEDYELTLDLLLTNDDEKKNETL